MVEMGAFRAAAAAVAARHLIQERPDQAEMEAMVLSSL